MIEYVLSIALIFLLWRTVVSSIVIHALSKEIANMKTQKDVEDRFVKANIDTLYKITGRNNTIPSYIGLPTKVPFYNSLPSIGLYSQEQLKQMEKEYDKKWEKFLEYKERVSK